MAGLWFFLEHHRTDFAVYANRPAILTSTALALPQTPAEVFPTLAPSFWRGIFFTHVQKHRRSNITFL